jgi:hypothetical protein
VCDFSRELPEDINMTDYEPDASYTWYGSGQGPIETVSPVQGILCYRYDVSLSKLNFEKISCRGCTPLAHIVSVFTFFNVQTELYRLPNPIAHYVIAYYFFQSYSCPRGRVQLCWRRLLPGREL